MLKLITNLPIYGFSALNLIFSFSHWVTLLICGRQMHFLFEVRAMNLSRMDILLHCLHGPLPIYHCFYLIVCGKFPLFLLLYLSLPSILKKEICLPQRFSPDSKVNFVEVMMWVLSKNCKTQKVWVAEVN